MESEVSYQEETLICTSFYFSIHEKPVEAGSQNAMITYKTAKPQHTCVFTPYQKTVE
jgi:hypothetical protein